MTIENISIDALKLKPLSLFETQWLLLTAGDFTKQRYNCMTISWGSIGVMWNKPFVQVVVRPTRYTHEFIQSYPDFTVCAFSEKYHGVLQLLGSKSGRDIDKVNLSQLTPCKSSIVNAPAYEEAILIIECRKIYSDVFKPQFFLDPKIDSCYNKGDYHSIYYGEIIAVRGDTSLYK
jgi:flavin reductase (DIM6/NTAB) family NADH-FMN oxidoreductase RutF